jgi:hypothetical protein
MNYPIIGVVGELGVKKRIYKRRLELNGGANLGILWLWGKISHIPEGYATGDTTMYIGDSIPSGTSVFMRGFSTGLSLNAGWEYLLTPELALTFEGGYRLYIPIKNKMWDVWARYDEKNWDLDFDNFIAKPGPADISGYWYSFGVIFSL